MAQPSRADALVNRSRLMNAAREVFKERGAEADIREICARAGVGPGTFYRNFATKEDLIRALATEGITEVHTFLAEAEAIEDPKAAVELFVQRVWEHAERNRELARIIAPHGIRGAVLDFPEFGATQERALRLIERAVPDGSPYPAPFVVDLLGAMIGAYLDLRETWDEPTVRNFMRGFLATAFESS